MADLLQTLSLTTTNTDVQMFQVPAGKIASFSLNVCNKTAGKVLIGIAMSTSATPGAGDYLEWNAEVLPSETLQRLGLVLGSSNYLFVRTNTSGLSVVLWGFLE